MKLRVITLGLAVLLFNFGYALAEESTKVKSPEISITKQEASGEVAHKYCLLCGPEEATEALSFSYKYKGKKYLFCSMDCLKAFKKNPEEFIKSEQSGKIDKDRNTHQEHDPK